MAKNSAEAYGAQGRTNLLNFDPANLKLVTDPSHPLFDSRVNLPLDENLVLNIMHHGVLEPIIINKNPETGDVEVVDGRQRVKNAREANDRLRAKGCQPVMVPAVVRRGTAAALAGVMVSTNELRREDTPLGRAEKMQKLLDLGRDKDELTVIFGCSYQTVVSTLALLDCCQAVKDAIESGAIGITHAKELAKLQPDMQRAKVAELTNIAQTANGHERSRKQREVVGKSEPRMKTRKQIVTALETVTGDYADALRWVLGE